MKFWQDHASYPFKSHDAWFVTEDIRWGKFEPTTDIKALVNKVNREDMWRDAAKALGVAAADIPAVDLARQGDLLRRQGVRSRRIPPPTSRACRSSASKCDRDAGRPARRPVLSLAETAWMNMPSSRPSERRGGAVARKCCARRSPRPASCSANSCRAARSSARGRAAARHDRAAPDGLADPVHASPARRCRRRPRIWSEPRT